MEKYQDTVKRHRKKRVKAPAEKTSPTSVRLRPLLSEFVEAARGDMSKSDYINWLVEKEKSGIPADDLPLQPQRRRRAPVRDQVQLAQAVALLGQSRLFSNLNQIALHLNQGVHVATPDTEAELIGELSRTRELRSHLYAALGKEPTP